MRLRREAMAFHGAEAAPSPVTTHRCSVLDPFADPRCTTMAHNALHRRANVLAPPCEPHRFETRDDGMAFAFSRSP